MTRRLEIVKPRRANIGNHEQRLRSLLTLHRLIVGQIEQELEQMEREKKA